MHSMNVAYFININTFLQLGDWNVTIWEAGINTYQTLAIFAFHAPAVMTILTK